MAAIAAWISAANFVVSPAKANEPLYGVYYDTTIGYPAVLADIDPLTGNILSRNIIGQYFGAGVAPLQYSLSGLTFGNSQLYGVYHDTTIGYPAVLADIDPLTGNGARGHRSADRQHSLKKHHRPIFRRWRGSAPILHLRTRIQRLA
jgi:hypothetical protein